MTTELLTAAELESEADRARERLGTTVATLSYNLKPARLFEEITEASGLRDMTPQRALQHVAHGHPIGMVACGLVGGYFAHSLLTRPRSAPAQLAEGSPSGEQSSGALRGAANVVAEIAETGLDHLQERAIRLREEMVDRAKEGMLSASDRLGAKIEDGLKAGIANLPGSPGTRPLLEIVARLVIAAALQFSSRR